MACGLSPSCVALGDEAADHPRVARPGRSAAPPPAPGPPGEREAHREPALQAGPTRCRGRRRPDPGQGAAVALDAPRGPARRDAGRIVTTSTRWSPLRRSAGCRPARCCRAQHREARSAPTRSRRAGRATTPRLPLSQRRAARRPGEPRRSLRDRARRRSWRLPVPALLRRAPAARRRLAGVPGVAAAVVAGVLAGPVQGLAGLLLGARAAGLRSSPCSGGCAAWGYAEREDDLLVRRGVLVRRVSVVPYGRMQYVDVTARPARSPVRPVAGSPCTRPQPPPTRRSPGCAGRGDPAARPAGRPGRGPGRRSVTDLDGLAAAAPADAAAARRALPARRCSPSSARRGCGTGRPRWSAWSCWSARRCSAALVGWVSWRTTRYRLADGELQVDSGVLVQRARRVPLARVQSVDVVRPLVARLLGLAELRLEVVGGSGTEAPLSYLTEPDAQLLRAALLLAGGGSAVTRRDAPPTSSCWSASRPACWSRRCCSGAPAVLAAVLLPVRRRAPPSSRRRRCCRCSPRRCPPFARHRRRRRPAGARRVRLHRRRSRRTGCACGTGCSTPASQTIPAGRVQALRAREPLLWRASDWARVEVDVAGYAGGRGEQQAGTSALLPVAPAAARRRAGRQGARRGAAGGRPARFPRRARWRAPLSPPPAARRPRRAPPGRARPAS